MKKNTSTRPRILLYAIFFTAVGFIPLSLPAQDGGFDPESVKPKGCNDKAYDCGYKMQSADSLEALPMAPSNMVKHRSLASSHDLTAGFPAIGSQGQQGSCVAWASTYYTKSYHEKRKNGWAFDPPVQGGKGNTIFSPAFVYNQINGGRDQGSVIQHALELLVRKGAVPWSTMPYNDKDYRKQPTRQMFDVAAKYRAKSYAYITPTNINAIKSEIIKGNPIVIGIPVDDGWYNLKKEVYYRSSGKNYGGHAMVIVGFDDDKKAPNGERGAFKIINSWGTHWGDKGFGWITYKMWAQVANSCLVLYDSEGEVQEPVNPVTVDTSIKAPSQVSASKGNYADRVNVSWSQVENATSYSIERSAGAGSEFEFLDYAQEATYDDFAVQPGISYQYRVIAVNDDGQSDPNASPVAEGFATDSQEGMPAQIVGLSATVNKKGSGFSVSLSWSPQENVIYQVRRYDNKTSKWKDLSKSVKSESYKDSSPVKGAMNTYVVRAVNSTGEGEYSTPAEANLSTPVVKPGNVSNVVASMNFKSKIEVKWDAVTVASKYYIFRYDYGEKKWLGTVTANSNSYEDEDSSVQSGQYIAYVVLAGNNAGYSGYSKPGYGKTNPNAARAGEPLVAPTGLKVNVDKKTGNFNLTWNKVAKAVQYDVYRKLRGQKEFPSTPIASVKGQTSFSEPPAGEHNQLFFYAVQAIPDIGAGSNSALSRAVSISAKKEIIVPRHRFVAGDGLKNFVGTWQARAWVNGKPVDYTLSVSGDGDKFAAEIASSAGKKLQISGKYAAQSRYLTGKRFQLEIVEQFNKDIAVVNLPAGRLEKERLKLVFSKG